MCAWLTKFSDDNAENDAHGAHKLHHRDVSLQIELRMRIKMVSTELCTELKPMQMTLTNCDVALLGRIAHA
jgi:hypothetical protein